MASGRFSKQGDWFSAKLNDGYLGDTVIGGTLSTAPSGLVASQGQATQPGDRVIFSPADALFWSNTSVGNLYTGTYRYIASNATSTSIPKLGHGAFWDLGVADKFYQVTSDEAANIGVALFAGVFLNAMTKGNYWWIQESGKATCYFRAAIAGTPTIGAGVYLQGGGNASSNDNGAFDQIVGESGNAGTYSAIDAAMVKFVGVAETLPANNNTSLVDLMLSRASFRW
jgi:hypothetical protein